MSPVGHEARPVRRAEMPNPSAASSVSLRYGDAVANLDRLGGRLTSLVVDGLQVIVSNGCDPYHWGSFPMAPWAGRLRHGRLSFDDAVIELPLNSPPHAMHGLVTDRVWDLLALDERSVTLAVDLGRAAPDPWPWPCRVVQSVSLGERGVSFELAVHSDEPMPAHVGWHPWFRRQLRPEDPVSAELDVTSGEVYYNDEDGLPSGELGPPPPPPWDHCFTGLAETPRLHWPGLLDVTVESDCDHWVLYDVEPAGICVEPWTGPPNCLNGPDPRIVTPGDPLVASMRWRWRRHEG